MTTNNESFAAALTQFLQNNPGWKSARQLVNITSKHGHNHTPREVGGALKTAADVETYRATDHTTYYRWTGKTNKEGARL